MKDKKTAFDFKKDIDAKSYISLLGLDQDHLTQAPINRAAVRTDVQSGGIHALSYLAKKNRKGGHSVKINHWVKHPDGSENLIKVAHLESVLDSKGKYTLSDAYLFGNKIAYQNEKHFFQFLSQLKDILREIRHHHLPSLKTLLDMQKSFIPDKKHYREGMDATGEPLFFEPDSFVSKTININQDKAALQKLPFFLVPSYILPALLGFHSDAPTEHKPQIIKIASGNEEETHRPFFAKADIKKIKGGGLHVNVQAWKKRLSSDEDKKIEKLATWFDLKFIPDPTQPDIMKLSYAMCCGKVIRLNDTKNSQKYKQIYASIKEVGIIEPPIVSCDLKSSNKYIILDGHLRIEILKDLKIKNVQCLISKDNESFTYNKYINKLSAIQEHRMILHAIKRGVSEEKLAATLDINIKTIILKRDLLKGICFEAVDLLKDKMVTYTAFPILKRMKPFRQIEAATLLNDAGVYSVSYARALLAATPKDQLVNPEKKKTIKGLNEHQMVRMESEMEVLQKEYKLVEKSYGNDVLNLTLAKGYIGSLLGNIQIVKYLAKEFPEILNQFQKIADIISLENESYR